MSGANQAVRDRAGHPLSVGDIVAYWNDGKGKQVARVLGFNSRFDRVKVRGIRFDAQGSLEHKSVQWVHAAKCRIADRGRMAAAILQLLDRDPPCSRCGK